MVVTSSLGAGLAGQSFKRILLVKPSSLGDVVHALPVLHGLRTRYPQAAIDWLIATPFAPLLEGHPELNETVVFDRRRFSRLGRSLRVTRDFVRFLRSLRGKRYDLVIDLQGLFRTGFLTRATGASVRIGFRQAREAAWVFYSHYLPAQRADQHAVDRYYTVAELLGFAEVPIEFNLALTDAVRADAAALLRSQGVGPDHRVVVVVPGARWDTKRWRPERFAEVMDELHSQGDVRCVVVGGPEEVGLCDRITGSCRHRPVNLAGRTTVPELAATIGLADAVLCQDSAAAHLAAALHRPLVCLTGPTNPSRTGPYGRDDDVIRADVDCAPCYLRRLTQCRYDHRCMRDIDTETVVSALDRALAHVAVGSG